MRATNNEIERAFSRWLREYQKNPESFSDLTGEKPMSYGKACARYLSKMLAKVRAK